jgi:hypothetical protein
MRPCPFTLSVVILLFAATPLARGGAPHVDCGLPFVFEGSDVNAVFLPYKYLGTRRELGETGKRISLLIQADTLIHALSYGRIASVQMEPAAGREDDCVPDIVLDKLVGTANNIPKIKRGKGIVLVWGVLFEEGDDIYLKTYVTGLRRDVRDLLKVKIGDHIFYVEPSAQVVSFPAHKITRSMLTSIEAAYSAADQVYEQPSLTAKAKPLPHGQCPSCPPGGANGYYVDRQEGNWLHVRWSMGEGEGDAGWIPARLTLESHSLDSYMPELHFIRGTVGYLRLRMTTDRQETARLRNLALPHFERFLESEDAKRAETASAAALQLSGIMRLSGEGAADDWVQASAAFERAQKLVPYGAEVRNAATMGHIYQDWAAGRDVEKARDRARELIATSLLRTIDAVTAQNLVSYYELLLPKVKGAEASVGVKPSLPSNEIVRRLDTLRNSGIAAPLSSEVTPITN